MYSSFIFCVWVLSCYVILCILSRFATISAEEEGCLVHALSSGFNIAVIVLCPFLTLLCSDLCL